MLIIPLDRYRQRTVHVDKSAQNIAAGFEQARHGFARERRRVRHGRSLGYVAVQRYAFSGLDED